MRPQPLTNAEMENLRLLDDRKVDIIAAWANRQLQCTHCGKCTRRCEVLRTPGLDIGKVQAAYERIMALPYDDQPAATIELVQQDYPMYNALRQCCFCGFCTAACAHHVMAPERMRGWRELFMRANLMPPDDSKLVMVDNEWHIFSAYRAIYQVAYPDFLTLDAAAEAAEAGEPAAVDTLFFPGCSLVSYAPDLMKKVGEWLTAAGVKWAFSDACCGSPLMSAGLFDRAHELRMRTIDKMRKAGITRMVTVCPGCGEEFAEEMAEDISIVPLPELMLDLARERADKEAPGFSPLERTSVTFFDSCHDRFDNRHANAIRSLFEEFAPRIAQCEMRHEKRGTLCCGAGGAVASYDPDITDRRIWEVIEEGKFTGAQTMVTMCPTCTYTVAQANLAQPDRGMDSKNYLEVLFGEEIDWPLVFAQLGGMWTGEYAQWLNATFF